MAQPNLLDVSMVSIPCGSDSIIALKIQIDGIFDTGADWNTFIRDLLTSGSIDGAIVSCGISWNPIYGPAALKEHHSAISNEYPAGVDHFGTNEETSFYRRNVVYTVPDPESPINYTYQIWSSNAAGTGYAAILYQNYAINTIYSGGFAGMDNFLVLMPLIMFVDADGNFLDCNGGPCIGALIQGTWNGVSPADGIFPVMTFNTEEQSFLPTIDNNTDLTSMLTSTNIPADTVYDNEVPIVQPDPYEPGGYSGGSTGRGDFDMEGDPQPFGPVPAFVKDGLDTGFYTLYNPSAGELRNLASYLWSNNFDLDLLKKLFNNPMDLILNFGVVPCQITSGGLKEVGIGLISTGVMMNTAAVRNVYLEFGPVDIDEAFSGYLDYAPYTRIDIILPFVGVVPLDTDAIMGRTIKVCYNIDILTGSCVAGINAGGHCIGEYAGNCLRPLPLTGADYSNMIGSLITTAGAIAAGVATGGGAGAVAGGLGAASSAIVNEGKPMIEKGGAISSAAGYLGHLKPTLICSIPHQCLPSTQISEKGFPSYVSGKIKSVIGYAEVDEIHLDNIPATLEELEELESILKGGFYS